MRRSFRLVCICLLAFAHLVHASTWSALERETRNSFVRLACEYKAGLDTIASGGEVVSETIDGMTLPGYKNLNGLHALIHTMPCFKDLFNKGDVLFVATNCCDGNSADPKIIYVETGENRFFRVVYTWVSDVRIVRAGTKEYARIFHIAKSMGSAVAQPDVEQLKPFLRPKVITFLDETGTPLSGTFGVHERDGRNMLSAWFRSGTTTVPNNGTVEFEDFPETFQLFFTSTDGFYTSQNVKLQTGSVTNIVRLDSSGSLAFSIASFPPELRAPIVVPCVRKTDIGYEQIRGIGIFPSVGQEFVFDGLKPGTYKVQLKTDYKNPGVIIESADIQVRLKEKAVLPPFTVKHVPANY